MIDVIPKPVLDQGRAVAGLACAISIDGTPRGAIHNLTANIARSRDVSRSDASPPQQRPAIMRKSRS